MIDTDRLAARQAEDAARLRQVHDRLKAEAEAAQARHEQTGRDLAALVQQAATVLADIRAGLDVAPELALLMVRALDVEDIWRRVERLPRRAGYTKARLQLWMYYADSRARDVLREMFAAGKVTMQEAGVLDAAWTAQVQQFLRSDFGQETLPTAIKEGPSELSRLVRRQSQDDDYRQD